MSSTCEHVSRRVQKTKKEIEQLKEELQKLLKRGIEEPKHDVQEEIKLLNTFEKEKETKTEKPERLTSTQPCSIKNVTVRSSFSTPQTEIKKQESPKKVRHYNVEEAREYIRKQKEKRLNQMKSEIKGSQNVVDLRKEKLRELQKKSLELVQKNVNLKRERSRSRERGKLDDHKNDKKENITTKIDRLKSNKLLSQNRDQKIIGNQEKTEPQKQTSSCFLKTNQNKRNVEKINRLDERVEIKNTNENTLYTNHSVPDLIVNNLQDNIKTSNDEIIFQNNNLTKEEAATKIQHFYRKYRDKKLKEKLGKQIFNIQDIIVNPENAQIVTNITETVDIPVWLTPKVESYPYNFINTVKRKLCYAINSHNQNKDVGVQIDLNDQKNIAVKIKEDAKRLLEQSERKENEDFGHYISFNDSKETALKIKDDIKKSLEESKRKNKNIELHGYFNNPKEITLNVTEDFKITPESYFDVSKLTSTKFKEKLKSLDEPKRKENGNSGSYIRSVYSIETSSNLKKDSKKSLEETKRNQSENKDVKPFLSQRLYLDLKKVENLNLLDKKDCDRKHSISDSESDTSKNIPDISTESASKKSIKSISGLKATSDSSLQINIDKIKDLKLEKPISAEMNFIERFCSKSSENIPKQSHKTLKSRSASSISNLKESEKNPSPLQVPNVHLIPSEPPTEYSNNDLKSFLEFMSDMDRKKYSKSKTDSFVSLPQSGSESVNTESRARSASRKTNKQEQSYSSSFSGTSESNVSSVPSLKRPSVAPTSTSQNVNRKSESTNIPNHQVSIKPGEVKCIETKSNTNQIHLKFEAELHLLNDFNESLRQFMAVEKTILDLHSKNHNSSVILQNQDTQTSAQIEEQQSFPVDNSPPIDEESISEIKTPVVPNINYSRGSDIVQDFSQLINEDMGSVRAKKDRSLVSVSLDLSQLDDTLNSTVDESISNVSIRTNESFSKNAFAGFSVGMFDQLIRDEDTRIENLKTILKIREKALLDRTKGELAWLEIQKKQLIETGQLHEASLLKKKQRGILIKLQHEKQEMQRLKQMQKQASKERKIVLKEQRNMIKAQLSNNYTIPKIKRPVQKERRQSGPIKVYNVHRETINTETSISRKNSVAEEIIITSRSESVIGQITEDCSADQESLFNSSARSILSKGAEDAKKSLLMREAALQKRKKAAEELLQWHQRLLEEERKIAELEMAANTIIKQAPSIVTNQNTKEDHHKFKGSQLNLLWLNMTGRDEKKFNESESYNLSPTALEKFCKEAKKAATKSEELSRHSSNTSVSTEQSIETKYSKKSTESDKTLYTSDFEPQVIEISENTSPQKNEIKSVGLENEIDRSKSTLNEIMQNISNITDEISAIYKLSTAANVNEHSATNESVKTSDGFVRTQSNRLDDTASGDEVVTEEIQNQKLSEVANDLDQQLNEILSEGTKRINNILNSRTQTFNKNSTKSSEGEISTNISSNTSGDIKECLKTSEISVATSTKNNLMDTISKSKFEIIDGDNLINKSKSLDEPSKSKSISITVLKPNEAPKANSLSSSVTLVKNLTELIKTGTENNIRNTPETKNNGNDSSGTFSPNGELLSGSNEPKVEINDKRNTSAPCQIGDIFSKGLAAEDGNLRRTEKDNGITVLYEATQLLDSSSNGSSKESFSKSFSDELFENNKIECNEKRFESNNYLSRNNEISSGIGNEAKVSKSESYVVSNGKSDAINSKVIKANVGSNSKVIKSDAISNNNAIKSDDDLSTIKNKSLQLILDDDISVAINTDLSEIQEINYNDINSEIITDKSEITNDKSNPIKTNSSNSKHNKSLLSNEESNKISKIASKTNEISSLINKSNLMPSNIIKTDSKEEGIKEISSDLNNSTKDKSQIKSNGEMDIFLIEKIGSKQLIQSDNSKLSNNVTSVINSEAKIKSENIKNKSNSIELLKMNKSPTLSNVSSIKDEDKNQTQSNKEESSRKIIFKPLKTLDESSSKQNYCLHNGHDNIKLDEEIIDLQNKFQMLSIENESKTNKLTSEHSDNNDTLETSHDVESLVTDGKEVTTNYSNDETIKETSQSETNEEELKKSRAINDNSESISITELSQSEEFQSGKSLNHQVSDKKNQSLSEKSSVKVDTELKSSGKSDKSGKLENKSEVLGSKSKSSGDATDFVNVKKRVSEILADAHSPRGDKSPRLQDIYTTTYDISSPDRSPEMASPVSTEKDLASVTQMYGEEAEALFKKQLAIEQEIKQLEQQQKEQIPYMYMREIPNKPPPPYTPPVTQPHISSAVPTSTEQLDIIVCNVARILHNSYYKGTLETTVLTDRDKKTFNLRYANIDKECYEYVFDLCKELAVEHYQQFVEKPNPSWLRINKKFLAQRKPYNELELRQHLFKQIKVLLGFEKDRLKENLITKWCRKKRDHVDEILIVESQEEEPEWTNYDEDEVVVKDELTNDIMKILIAETAQVWGKLMKKRLTQSPS